MRADAAQVGLARRVTFALTIRQMSQLVNVGKWVVRKASASIASEGALLMDSGQKGERREIQRGNREASCTKHTFMTLQSESWANLLFVPVTGYIYLPRTWH